MEADQPTVTDDDLANSWTKEVGARLGLNKHQFYGMRKARGVLSQVARGPKPAQNLEDLASLAPRTVSKWRVLAPTVVCGCKLVFDFGFRAPRYRPTLSARTRVRLFRNLGMNLR